MIVKMFLVLTVFLLSSCDYALGMQEEFVLPMGFRGGVVIFFEDPEGVEPERRDGKTVYNIPEDGVLRLKSSPTYGRKKKQFYFQSENGKLEEIPQLQVTGERNPDGTTRKSKFGDLSQEEMESKLFVMQVGGVAVFEPKGKTIKYTSFYVSTPNEGDAEYLALSRKINGLVFGQELD